MKFLYALLTALLLWGVALPEASAQSCPSGAITSSIGSGQTLRVVGIHSDDAYNGGTTVRIGDTITTTGAMNNNGGCWFGGPAVHSNGTSLYFYKVAFAAASGGASNSCPSSALTSSIGSGQTLRIAAINTEDAYHGGTTLRIGDTITTTGAMNNNGGCWYGGPATHSNGTSLYFYKVAFERASGGTAGNSCPSSAVTGAIGSGQTLRIAAINTEDAYHGGSTLGIGDTITTTGAMNNNGGCWYGGPATHSNGTSLYFYKVAFERAGGGDACPRDAITSAIGAGQTLRVVGVSSEDAYYGGTTVRVGDTITTTSALNNNGGCWYGGPATHSNGTGLYFYKVAFAHAAEDKEAGSGDLPSAIRAIVSDDAIDGQIESMLLGRFDRNGSGTIDNNNELDAISCDVLVAIDARYRQKWGGSSVRQILGFHSNYIWVGSAIGFAESLRVPGDRKFDACGVRI